MTTPQNGEWYLASDGQWYCWPDPTPHAGPPQAPVAPPLPATPELPSGAPEYPSWLKPPEPSAPAAPVGPPGAAWGAPAAQAPAWGQPQQPAGWQPATPYGQQRPVVEQSPIPAYCLAGFGGLLLISTFLPWVSADVAGSENGFGSGFNGIIVAIGGILAIASGVSWLNGQRQANIGWSAAFSGLIDVFCTIEDLLDVRNAISSVKEFFGDNGLPPEISEQVDAFTDTISVGAGLYLALIAAIGIVVSAIWLAITTPKN